jgi:hypothetical protein
MKLVFKPLMALSSLSLLFNLCTWLTALLLFPRDTPAAVLHYSTTSGIDFIGQGSQIIFLPLLGSILLVLNLALGFMIYRTSVEASWVLWGSLPLPQLVLLTASLVLWNVNV